MPKFEVIEAKPWHCGQIVRTMRPEHADALSRFGTDYHFKLRACFDASAFRRSWLIDGRLGAIGGVTGTLLAPMGYLWLAVSQDATRYPKALLREALTQIEELLLIKTDLYAVTLSNDKAAERFARHVGFLLQQPMEQDGLLMWGIKPWAGTVEPPVQSMRLH